MTPCDAYSTWMESQYAAVEEKTLETLILNNSDQLKV